MLPERYRELLTAYVDGELSARQRRHIARLLQRSSEARRLLQGLQSDSRELHDLPRTRLDRDLSATVVQKIAARHLAPARPVIRRFPTSRSYPTWAGAAAAAAVLLLVGAASYSYFAASLDRSSAPSVAAVQGNNAPPPIAPEMKAPADSANSVAQAPGHEAEVKHDPDLPPHPPVDEIAHQKPVDHNSPPAMEKEDPVFTSEGMEMFTEIQSVVANLDVPATFKLHDLEQDAVHRKLLTELQKGAALRLELPVRDGTEAFKRLQTVLKAHHVELAIDASAARRLERPALHTNYVLYTEDLTADELDQVVRQLAVEEKKEKAPAANPFDRLVVRRLTERDHKELSDLMGVDPVQAAPAKEAGPLGLDPHKSVSEGTAAQLAAPPARPEPGKPAAKPAAEHPLLVMPYNPVRPKRDSAEVKRFLEERRPLRAGALQVVLVLRGPTG